MANRTTITRRYRADRLSRIELHFAQPPLIRGRVVRGPEVSVSVEGPADRLNQLKFDPLGQTLMICEPGQDNPWRRISWGPAPHRRQTAQALPTDVDPPEVHAIVVTIYLPVEGYLG